MKRGDVNYWVNVLLVICLLVVGVTGLILKFAFVSGEPGVGRRIVFMGFSKMDLLPWHEWFGLAMVVLMILHLILHFNWLKVMTGNLFSKGGL